MLAGRRATTSWWLAPYFRKRYPAVTMDETRMVTTCDGVTTAGAAFGHVDLAPAIVRMTSPALADPVARYLVVDERPSQAAYTISAALAQSDPAITRKVGHEHADTLRILLRERTGETAGALRRH
ncbi:hypothetical protein JK361_36595 [Streptomyces sp. 5-8]|uniref:LysR substrate-binding domain-containing protein n=1 Tax=Streptomyces musisoli TaxID=2802280 RepID=A0ABS1PDV5_9ACTN|nr:hypothetical protein [Streptomyces musisoli]MBL1110021.1 hypothetical protein [Streptomyces musisoli]